MGMLDTVARTWMKAAAKSIHDDWPTTATVRKLASSQGAQMDELGWVTGATPSYQFSYSVSGIFHPPGTANRSLRGRDDRVLSSAGKEYAVEGYFRIHTDNLAANPAPDTDCELVISGRTYRVTSCDVAANQYLLTLTSEK
jgi:hypothetical protein